MFARRLFVAIVVTLFGTWSNAQTVPTGAAAKPADVPLKPARSQFDNTEFRDFINLGMLEPAQGGPQGPGREVRTVHGQLVDYEGKPIAGAQVLITEDIGHDTPAAEANFDVTDQLGRFVLTANLRKDRVIVRRGRQSMCLKRLEPGQEYMKFVWPKPSTLRLEIDLKLCAAGKLVWLGSMEDWGTLSYLSGPQIVRAQSAEGVALFDWLVPNTYRVKYPKLIKVGDFDIEQTVEVARVTTAEGETQTLRVSPDAGIAVTGKAPIAANGPPRGRGGIYVEIQTFRTRYKEFASMVDVAAVAEDGRFSARVPGPGQYELVFNTVVPTARLPAGGPAEEGYETQSWGGFRFEVKPGETEVEAKKPERKEALSPTVEFVQRTIASRPSRDPGYSWLDVQVADLARYDDREGVAAELLRILNDEQAPYEWVQVALKAVGQVTDTEGVVEGLLALLESPVRNSNRYSIIRALENSKRKVPQVIDRFEALSTDGELGIRGGAYLALEQLGGKQSDYRGRITPILIRALADTHNEIRARAAGALGWFAAKEAEQPLRGLLADPDMSVRMAAGQAIWKISGDSGPLVHDAIELLSHENMSLRASAAYQLELLDKLPPEAVAALRANLVEEQRPPRRGRGGDPAAAARSSVSQAALRALKKHGALDE